MMRMVVVDFAAHYTEGSSRADRVQMMESYDGLATVYRRFVVELVTT